MFHMDLRPDQLAASLPPAVTGGAALLSVSVLALCSVLPLYRRSHRSDVPYQDQDGSATAESEKKAQTAGRNASSCALLVSSVGLVVTANGRLKGIPRLRETGLDREAVDLILLVLISIQVVSTYSAKACSERYRLARATVLSSAIALIYALYAASTKRDSPHELAKIGLLVILAIILSCVPSKPEIYLQNAAVVNRNGASLLSWITFSYGFLHQKSTAHLPAKLSLEHVPAVDSSFRTETLRKRFGHVRAGDRIWLRLLQFCQGPLVLQCSFVLLKAMAEFGSRYALFNLLQGMENNDSPGNKFQPWKWVGVMLLGMLSGAVADSWLYWVTSGVLHSTVVSALDALVIEKMMRRENINDSNDKLNKSSSSGEMFRDTYSIARAVLDNYQFPLATLKTFLDISYLSRLLSVRSLLIGSFFPVATTLLSKRLAQQHQALQRGQVASQRKNTSSLIEMLQTLHHIRLSSLEHFWSRRLFNSIADMQHHRWETTIALEKLNFFSNLGPILLASVAISVHALESGQLSPAVAFTALSFFSNLQGIFAELPAKAATLHKSWISI